tara:strand:- start:423 stop:1277 length:855 start_codon:yes stop_codon:yes gene_type:complete
VLELQIRHTLEKLSNNEGDDLHVDDQWIEDAGEYFKDTLRRQFSRKQEAPRLRMSNIGRPSCQLQMAMAGKPEVRKPYNFFIRMVHGDIIESVMEVILRIAKANITGGKNRVEMKVSNTLIKGEDDIDIDHKTYDIKSCSPYAYNNKWAKGYAGLKSDDSFGYIGQLYGYATGQGKEPGGWIVVDKSSGEVSVVEAEMDAAEKTRVKDMITETVKTIEEDRPFKRCFEPQDEKFGRNFTGRKRLNPSTCGFCDHVKSCWPNAEYKPQPESKAAKQPHFWYVEED